ncbi:dimethyladenosine transferase [Segatella salivae DSM 15606]|uniref:Dimethyladenosine transferase n=1 Tax=Segatella salivae DSM 15606 TaxID=888832 RepID=E6MS45_9BACT|nr:dimethyladenosine transferase [Segatella salivae DSM 15606]
MKLVRAKKHLGQHFLTDLNIAKRIADTVDACPAIPILEIGPGMGVLTQYLVTKNRGESGRNRPRISGISA